MFLIIPLAYLSSCSGATYSIHSGDKIKLVHFNKTSSVYIEKGSEDEYNLHSNVISNVIEEFKKNDIKIASNKESATHVFAINFKSILVDIDYEFANSMRNLLVTHEITPSYVFDSGNSPHMNSNFVVNNFAIKNKYKQRILPSVAYTVVGASVGFVGGWLLAGSFMPMYIGVVGAVIGGGITYFLYNTFRTVGIMITYEISIDEKIPQQIKHSVKSIAKKSSNIADEVFYDYHDHWSTNISKNIIICLGSKALRRKIISNTIPMISSSAIESFNFN